MCGRTEALENVSQESSEFGGRKATITTSSTIPRSVHHNTPINVHRAIQYGTLSLALVILASTVTMGHYQSQRDQLGCDSFCVGSLTSARSTLTLIGSTVVGKVSDWTCLDRLGGARKIVLLVGVLASATGVVTTLTATSIQGLWLSMIPSALLQQNFNVLKALFGEYHGSDSSSSSSSSEERAAAIGMLGMAAGLAFMVGPLAGTMLLQTYEQASIFALVCLLLSAIIILVFLPTASQSNHHDHHDQESSTSTSNEKSNSTTTSSKDKNSVTVHSWTPWNSLVSFVLPAKHAGPALFVMAMRLFMGLAFHIFQTIWMIALQDRFQFGPKDYGRYYAFIGLAFALSQGFGAKIVLKHFGTTLAARTRLLLICCTVLGLGRWLVYQTHSLVVVYAIYGAMITALGVVNTIVTADTTQLAHPKELGGLFGILASVESMSGIVGPMLGGMLATLHPVHAPLTAVVGLYGMVFAMVFVGYEQVLTSTTKPTSHATSSSSSSSSPLNNGVTTADKRKEL